MPELSDFILITFTAFAFIWMEFYVKEPSDYNNNDIEHIVKSMQDSFTQQLLKHKTQYENKIKQCETKTDLLQVEIQEKLHTLENTIQTLTKEHKDKVTILSDEYKENLEQLEKGMKEYMTSSSKRKTGANYLRYGHHGCPDTAKLVYNGFVGSGENYEHGGGANYVCLPKDPQWPTGAKAKQQPAAGMHGVEYKLYTESAVTSRVNNDHDVPCAVCEVEERTQTLMIPGKYDCAEGWTKEYSGLLMTNHVTYKKSTDFACVDGEMQTILGGADNKGGGLFYIVHAVCGSLKCPPYKHGYEIACVVCTK